LRFRDALAQAVGLGALRVRPPDFGHKLRRAIAAFYPLKHFLSHGFRRRKTFLQWGDRSSVNFNLFSRHGVPFSSINTPLSKLPAMLNCEKTRPASKPLLRLVQRLLNIKSDSGGGTFLQRDPSSLSPWRLPPGSYS